MKIKKNPDPQKQAKAIEAPDEEMQDLDLETMSQMSGAGNPFDRPRMGFQPIDDDLRGNG